MNEYNRMDEFLVKMYCCMHPNCDKAYNTKFNLKRHVIMQHLKEKHFHCPQCDRDFSSNQNLKEHSYLHTGLKPYICKVCGANYRQASQLSLHNRVHCSKSTPALP